MFKGLVLKNEKGFTLIEMMIAGLIAVIVHGGSIYAFTKQDKLIRQENAKSNLRALGRVAMTELVTEIRRAGYGLPAGQGIIAADTANLSFLADVQDVYAMLAVDVSAGNTISVTDITAPSGFAFQDGDTIAISDGSSSTNWELNTINGAPVDNVSPTPDVITIQTALAPPGGNYQTSKGVVIHQYHSTIYNYAANRITASVDGGAAVPVIAKVTAMNFQYFDTTVSTTVPLATPVSAANLLTINRILVNMTLQDDIDTAITLSFNSGVNIRNNS